MDLRVQAILLKIDSVFRFCSDMNGWVSVLNQGHDFLTWFEEIFLTLLDIPCDFENRSCWCLPATLTHTHPTSNKSGTKTAQKAVISRVFSKLKYGRRNPICQGLIASTMEIFSHCSYNAE